MAELSQKIIETLNNRKIITGEVTHTRPLQGGISAEMTAIEILLTNSQTQTLILRLPNKKVLQANPRAAEHEHKVLQALHSHGINVPKPIAVDSETNSFILLEYIEGENDYSPINPINFARQLASELAKIHSVNPAKHHLSFLPGPANHFIPPFHQNAPPGSLPHTDPIRGLLNNAWPFPQQNPSTLLHGDYWPGNVLWRNGQLAAIIDWEDACLGDPLIDLAIARLDLLWIINLEAMNTFTGHYCALTGVNTTALPYWDLCAALRLARLVGNNLTDWAAFFHPFGRSDITEQSILEYYRFFIRQALETINNSLESGLFVI